MNNVIEINTALSRNTFGNLPTNIDYDVVFEPTKAPHKKYVVNGVTGEYLDTVGEQHSKGCVSHPAFFHEVQDAMIDELPQHQLPTEASQLMLVGGPLPFTVSMVAVLIRCTSEASSPSVPMGRSVVNGI